MASRQNRPPQRSGRKKSNNKIVRYKKPMNINIGMIIFGVVFVYILICVIMFFRTKHIIGYEVNTGSLSVANVYQGIALRDEMSVSSNNSGYVNYFAREGAHVASGDLVYTVDQSGTIADMIENGDESITLSETDLDNLKTEMIEFEHGFSAADFSNVYDFKYAVQGSALKMANYNMLNNMDAISKTASGSVDFCYAPVSGTVVYSKDGFENLKAEQITADTFDQKNYEKNQLISNELVGSDEPVYKIITSEDWSIVIPVTKERAAEMEEEGYVEVKFLKNQYTSWGSVTIFNSGEDTFAKLDFNNSMTTFATERFIDLEVLDNTEEGLKIPISAIAERNFYLIPKEYMVKGGNSSADGFMLETYAEDGTVSTEFKEVTIYSESDTDYYVDTSALRIGDYVCMPDSTEKYAISKTGSLVGVYNINKGYADFTEITILAENEEYAIVKSNTQYGLSEYDRIVLDAESVSADDFIYE